MTKYLWDFSFDELFFKENGYEVVDKAKTFELTMIDELRGHYEKVAKRSRDYISKMDSGHFIEGIPGLMRTDMILQLCLIYSLSISEMVLTKRSFIQMIEEEAVTYFREYRVFRETYSFEKYSLMNKIAMT